MTAHPSYQPADSGQPSPPRLWTAAQVHERVELCQRAIEATATHDERAARRWRRALRRLGFDLAFRGRCVGGPG
jgi:hypothetical protein